MKNIFLILCLFSTTALADITSDFKLEKANNKPVSNLRLTIDDDFRFDVNTLITEKSLMTGKYDSDIGAIYKLTSIDSVRVSVAEKNNTMLVNYRHRF
jgi:hypothetical protein